MWDERARIALLQESYTAHGGVCGIPAGLNIIANDGRVKAAVVLNGEQDSVAVDECVIELGVCV